MSNIVLFDTLQMRRPWYRAGGAPQPVVAYQPKGAASLLASYVNLAAPGVSDAAPGVAPTFNAATGWTFNGTTQYLVTPITPTSGYSMLIRFSGAADAQAAKALCGSQKAGNLLFYIVLTTNATNAVTYAAGQSRTVNPELLAGVLSIGGQQGYRNGVADGAAMGAWGVGSGNAVYIGCSNTAGTPGSFISASVQLFAIWLQTLTPTEMLAVSLAAAAL